MRIVRGILKDGEKHYDKDKGKVRNFVRVEVDVNKQSADAAFVSFCVERYAAQTRRSGAEVIQQFEHTGVLDYLFNNYDALHTQGWGYIFPVIHEYMAGEET